MYIGVKLYGRDSFIRRTSNVSPQLRAAVMQRMQTEMRRVSDYVRARKLSGQVLNRRSGDLSRSITGRAESDGLRVLGKVGSYGVPYAAVHEFGGTFEIPAHSRMISQVFGRPVFPHAVAVRAYSATFPTRSFVQTSAKENETAVSAALREAVLEVLNAT